MIKQILVFTAMIAMIVVGCSYAGAIPMPKQGGPMEGEGGPGGPPFEMPGGGPVRNLDLLVVALDLSEAQKVQVQKIFNSERTCHEEFRQERQKDEQTLHQLLDADSFDEAAFRAMSIKVAEKRIDMMVARAKLKPQVLAVLSVEQQAKGEKIFKLLEPPLMIKGNPFDE